MTFLEPVFLPKEEQKINKAQILPKCVMVFIGLKQPWEFGVLSGF